MEVMKSMAVTQTLSDLMVEVLITVVDTGKAMADIPMEHLIALTPVMEEVIDVIDADPRC